MTRWKGPNANRMTPRRCDTTNHRAAPQERMFAKLTSTLDASNKKFVIRNGQTLELADREVNTYEQRPFLSHGRPARARGGARVVRRVSCRPHASTRRAHHDTERGAARNSGHAVRGAPRAIRPRSGVARAERQKETVVSPRHSPNDELATAACRASPDRPADRPAGRPPDPDRPPARPPASPPDRPTDRPPARPPARSWWVT